MHQSRFFARTVLAVAIMAGALLATVLPAWAARPSGPVRSAAARQSNSAHQLRSPRHRMPARTPRRAPRSSSLAFPVRPVMSVAAGAVTITPVRGGYRVTVSVGGLPAYSVHSLHVHAGSCAGAYVGVHLYVLGTLHATRNGTGTFSLVVPYSPAISGHYLIVYAGPFAGTIAACADL